MAVIYRYVDTAASPGGDGLSWGTAYNSLSAWNAAEVADLTAIPGGPTIHHVICRASSGAADVSSVDITGWTTNSSNYIIISSDSNHGGKWDSSIYRIENGSTSVLKVSTKYTVLSGIQVYSTSSTGVAFHASAPFVTPNVESPITFVGCIARGSSSSGKGFYGQGTLTSTKIQNCLAYDYSGTGGYGFLIHPTFSYLGYTGYTYNNTAINCATGFDTSSGDTTNILSNNLAIGCTDGFNGSWHASSTNNCSDIVSDALGANPVTGTPTFVDYAGDDFNLTINDSVARDAGADLSSTVVTDAKLLARPQGAGYDIGFSEVSTATFDIRSHSIIAELKAAHEYRYHSIGTYLRKFNKYPYYTFEVQSDGTVSWKTTNNVNTYPLKNRHINTQKDVLWDAPASVYIASGIIPVSGIDEYQFQMDELYDPRINSGFVNYLKSFSTSPQIIGTTSATSVDMTGWARELGTFAQAIQSGIIDTVIDINSIGPWYIKKIPSSNDTEEHGMFDRAVGYNYRTDTYPSGQLQWTKGASTGIINCNGTGRFAHTSGAQIKNLDFGGTQFSTHGWVISDSNTTALYKTHEAQWREKLIGTTFNYALGNVAGFPYSVDKVEFAGFGENMSYLYRNNPSGLSNFQVSDDWYPSQAPGTGAGTEEEIGWARWQGYISNSGVYDSSDSTTAFFGSQASERSDGSSDESSLWRASLEALNSAIIASGYQNKLSLSGKYLISTLSGIQDRNSYVSDFGAGTSITGNSYYEWSAGEVWSYVNKMGSIARAKETSFSPVIAGYTENENSARFGKALTAITDQTHAPLAGGTSYNSSYAYSYSKLNLGYAVTKPYKEGTWIIRDFSNGKVQINDVGINILSTDDVYSKVKIDVYDIVAEDIPNLWNGWVSDRNVIYSTGVSSWKAINSDTTFSGIVGQEKPSIEKVSLNYYDGVASGILSAGDQVINWNGVTIYLVMDIKDSTSPGTIVSHHYSNGNRSFDIQRYSAATQDFYRMIVYTDDYPAGNFIQMDDQASIGEPGVFCFQYKSGDGRIYRNGILEGSNSAITGALQGGGAGIPLVFGGLNSSGSYSQRLNSSVYALFICTGFHSDEDRQAVEAILMNRYNLQ